MGLSIANYGSMSLDSGTIKQLTRAQMLDGFIIIWPSLLVLTPSSNCRLRKRLTQSSTSLYRSGSISPSHQCSPPTLPIYSQAKQRCECSFDALQSGCSSPPQYGHSARFASSLGHSACQSLIASCLLLLPHLWRSFREQWHRWCGEDSLCVPHWKDGGQQESGREIIVRDIRHVCKLLRIVPATVFKVGSLRACLWRSRKPIDDRYAERQDGTTLKL